VLRRSKDGWFIFLLDWFTRVLASANRKRGQAIHAKYTVYLLVYVPTGLFSSNVALYCVSTNLGGVFGIWAVELNNNSFELYLTMMMIVINGNVDEVKMVVFIYYFITTLFHSIFFWYKAGNTNYVLKTPHTLFFTDLQQSVWFLNTLKQRKIKEIILLSHKLGSLIRAIRKI
jgi:hypothetical protein